MDVIDIPGAYLQADTDEHVIMLLKGSLVDLMAMIDPNLYRKFVVINSKGESMLYVKIQKVRYALLRSA